MEILVFVAIAMVFAVGVVFVTGKGLGYLYADKKPMTDEEVAEYTEHTNPIHMCRFIGSCFMGGAVVAALFAVALITACHVVDIIAISLACASVVAAFIVYLVVFRYKPMKARFLAAKEAEEKAAAEEAKKTSKKKAEQPKEVKKVESADSKRVKAVSAIRGKR